MKRLPRALSCCAAIVAAGLGYTASSHAQTCWVYVDSETARVPLACRDQGDLSQNCSWDPDCFDDNDASDCCTSIPASSAQNILTMHTNWHNCFGNIGAADGNNPPGRGQRWYAFHRQFEFDFNLWRADNGIDPIESLEWCPSMTMLGHFGGGLTSHPAGCGSGPDRPSGTSCVCCQAFAPCLFHSGGGPIDCAPGAVPAPNVCPGGVTAPGTCGTPGGINFPYTALDQFPNVEQVSNLLDDYFHGVMHGAVAFGDDGTTVSDSANPSCSPRDPMFWRLHKALDDVVRAWQDRKPVDVVVVIDRSGSMTEPDSGGGTKFAAALSAVDMFADLLETCDLDPTVPSACNVQANRIGLVSFSGTASIDMPLTVADPNLRAPAGPLTTALATLTGTPGVPGGCTGMGLGVQKALEMLCPPSGDCRNQPAPPAGVNARKGILLLTDGLENIPPCLQPASPTPGPTCGTTCHGAQVVWENLEFTQLVAVGFGNAASLNGDVLTLLAERQGGIYMQNPNGAGDDLKDFFAKAFGRLSDEFLLVDPNGQLAADDPASEIVEYVACGDEKLTFASGWHTDAAPGELRLLVRSPDGDLVRAGEPGVEASRQTRWDFARTSLPYRGAAAGTWTAQLVRPHRSFLNGFAPDAFLDPKAGIAIARAEIQRLCPDGCRRALLYENGVRGSVSVYREALAQERAAGLVGAIDTAADPAQLARALADRWDLIVYARMGADARDPEDGVIFERLCRAQRVIASELRPRAGAPLMRCLGGLPDEPINWTELTGNAQLFTGVRLMSNPGHPVATIALQPLATAQATAAATQRAAIVARAASGKPHPWFIDILGRTLSKLEVHHRRYRWRTGDDLVVSARILPSYVPAGGWDEVDARVEVEYPTIGVGKLLAREPLREDLRVGGEMLDPRAAALSRLQVPTQKATFRLYDDGTHGDLHPGNAYWTAILAGLGDVDGVYRLHFVFDLTKNGCTTRRELVQSLIVDVAVDPKESGARVVARDLLPDGATRLRITVQPADTFGNKLGPGLLGAPVCAADGGCRIEESRDQRDGSYDFTLATPPGAAGLRLSAFAADFDLPLPCVRCASLSGVTVPERRLLEHGRTDVTVALDAPAPKSGATIYLTSSSPRSLRVPATVAVPPGQDRVTFTAEVLHAHEGVTPVTVAASYGGRRSVVSLSIVPRPADPKPAKKGEYIKYQDHRHPQDH